MSGDDVSDPTDWLTTPLTAVAAVEAALRCKVCKDFFKTPMTTTCLHTFCSVCIRRALVSDGRCPLCRASEQELKLRKNWSLEEAVEAFVSARPAMLELARQPRGTPRSPKRRAGDESSEAVDAPPHKRLRSSARLSRSRGGTATPSAVQEEEEVVEVSDDDDEYVPEPGKHAVSPELNVVADPAPADGLVPCPVCQKRMKEWQVFSHLETCTGPTPPPPKKSSESSRPISTRPQKPPERLPALNYAMFKDQVLRKKLADLGISNQGPRLLLERRHREWMTIWNANCDAARPRTQSELLHDLDIWERTQGGRAPTTGRALQNAAIIKDKHFDGAAWGAKHDSSFKDLIASARRSKREAQNKADENRDTPSEEPQTIPGAADPVPEAVPTVEGQEIPTAYAHLVDGTSPEHVLSHIQQSEGPISIPPGPASQNNAVP
ncbi:hypothetical protein S40293_01578 [Stachybotrys chartarum IBT 40293]|nr:hypothetical protein S40293_01578 [Stachybotrys chartarum IBT 40293]KFA75609.1 hypothetical protein S40288_04448 [Stachybotrys chartarum IBT 40288]